MRFYRSIDHLTVDMNFIQFIRHSYRTSTIFILFLLIRLISSIFNPIDDCDEVFNFYEPLHYLRYGQGLQTWEYSPLYALRSYAYLIFHWFPISFIPIEFKLLSFYSIRIYLSVICAIAETFFVRSIERQWNRSISGYYFIISLLSTAMFRSSTSFINNSFSMFSILFAFSFWFSNSLMLSVFFIGLGSLFGWIYLVILGIPLAFDILIRRQLIWQFIRWTLFSALIILIPMTLIDSFYYGQLVIAPLNHIKYNLFSPHGPTLYGVEPWSYYLKNGLLNFNIVYLLALGGILLSPMIDLFVDHRYVQSKKAAIPHTLINSSVVLWMTILWLQPHKEDRFIFPINPLILLSASICLHQIEMNFSRLNRFLKFDRQHLESFRSKMILFVVILYGCLSLSRTCSIIDGYSAPIRLFVHSNTTNHLKEFSNEKTKICVGKDWFRFPSHFLLPQKSELAFIRSQFRGQLPKHYNSSDDGTRLKEKHFNDANREENDRYVNLSECDFLFDHDRIDPDEIEPNYSDTCRSITTMKMISPSKGSLLRLLYIPWLSQRSNDYRNLHFLDCSKKKFSR